jgi:hypothetical protein
LVVVVMQVHYLELGKGLRLKVEDSEEYRMEDCLTLEAKIDLCYWAEELY